MCSHICVCLSVHTHTHVCPNGAAAWLHPGKLKSWLPCCLRPAEYTGLGVWGPMFWGGCLSVLCPPADRIGSPAPERQVLSKSPAQNWPLLCQPSHVWAWTSQQSCSSDSRGKVRGSPLLYNLLLGEQKVTLTCTLVPIMGDYDAPPPTPECK